MPIETTVLAGVPAVLNGGFQVAQTGFALQQVPKEIREQFQTIMAIKTDVIKAKERRIAAAKSPNPPDLPEWDRTIREVEDALSALEKLTEPARLDMKHNDGKIKKSTRLMWVLRDSKSVPATNNRLIQASLRMGQTTMSHSFHHHQSSGQHHHQNYYQHQPMEEIPPPYHEDTKKAINERRKEEQESISRSPSISPPTSPHMSPPMSSVVSPTMSPLMSPPTIARTPSPSLNSSRLRFMSDPEPQSLSGRMSIEYDPILPTSRVAELVPPSPTHLHRYSSTPAAPTLSSMSPTEVHIPHSHSTSHIPPGTQGSIRSGWGTQTTEPPARHASTNSTTYHPPVSEPPVDVDPLTTALQKLHMSKAKRAKNLKAVAVPAPVPVPEEDTYFSPDDIRAPSAQMTGALLQQPLPTRRSPPSPPPFPPQRDYGVSTSATHQPTREAKAPIPPYPVSREPTVKEYYAPSAFSSNTTNNQSRRHIAVTSPHEYELKSNQATNPFRDPSRTNTPDNPFRDPADAPRVPRTVPSTNAGGVTTTQRALAGHRHLVSLRYKPYQEDNASSRPPSLQLMGSPPPRNPPSSWKGPEMSIDEGDYLENSYKAYRPK